MKKIRFTLVCLGVLVMALFLSPVSIMAQDVELPLTWNGEGKAVALMDNEIKDVSVKCTITVDSDGWVKGSIIADDNEEESATLKRFYYEAEVDGARKLVIVFVDKKVENPGLYILNLRILNSTLLYGEVFRKDFDKEGEVETNLYLDDQSAQEIYPDYFPPSLKKAMDKCKPVGCIALKGSIVK